MSKKKNRFFNSPFQIMGFFALYIGIHLMKESIQNYIVKKDLYDLVVLFVFGVVFSVIGFFASGIYFWIHRMLHPEEYEEEELPPEEYVELNAANTHVQNPKRKRLGFVIRLLLFLGLLFILMKSNYSA